jgi:hypothetical protein
MRQSVVTLVVILATIPANAQTTNHEVTNGKAKAATKSAALRTPDGHPDLQGVWTNDTITPLERPKPFAGKAFFDASEQAAFRAATLDYFLALLGDENLKTSGDAGFVGREFGTVLPDRRTSLLVDPPTGALPPLLPTAQRHRDASIEHKSQHVADGPEDFDISERCISRPSPPMLPQPDNAHLRIVQTHDYVVIHTELFGEARVVPLDGRPHLPPAMRQWKGDSRGRWEADTLVIETKNFRPQDIYGELDLLKGVDESLRVIERFTLVDADTILYSFTVDDPTAYASAWTAELPFSRTSKPMFEYACHEGNYSLKNSLLGARAVERKKAADPQ